LRFNPDIFWTGYSFRRFLTYSNDVYGRQGFYLEHLQKFLALYPRESILILLYDDILKNPGAIIQEVYRFLQVDSSFVPPSMNVRINPMNFEITEHRSETLARISANLRLSSKLKGIGLARIGRLINPVQVTLVKPNDFPARHQMDPEIRARMAELYRDHNKKLGEFLGRDLSHWNYDTQAQ